MTLGYPFTAEQLDSAAAAWGCNCGPSALAFAMQKPLDFIRDKIPGFAEKGYTSPTMMRAALTGLNQRFTEHTASKESMHHDAASLVRIQFTGPWTQPGMNPKWAYWHTHWIATWIDPTKGKLVFDCNGGADYAAIWEREVIPFITKHIGRADGGWYPTHVWTLIGGAA